MTSHNLRAWVLGALRSAENKIRALRRSLVPAELVAFEDITAPWFSSALGTAVLLGLPRLVQQSVAISDLARQVDVSEQELRRLLDVLVAHGYFKYVGSEIQHTNLSRALEPGRSGKFCELQSRDWYRRCFCPEVASQSLTQGQTPYLHLDPDGLFESFQDHPERAQLFSEAMAEITSFCGPFLAAAVDISPGARVLDVGGGNGRLCSLLSVRFPQAHFAALDRAGGTPVGGVDCLQGCFMEAIPDGFDHLILKNILHDWEDAEALRILDNCAQAVAEDSRLTIIEMILPERPTRGDGSQGDFGVDWNVYCTLGGKERRLREYRELLGRSGWQFEDARPTGLPLWVLSARRT